MELETILELTAKIVSAYLARNQAAPDALPGLIQDVHSALAGTGKLPDAAPQEPAVPIKKSIFPDHIVCLEDGKKLKMLKRHLRTRYGMTPGEYRTRWGLPDSYPMVAPSYAAHRSGLAKKVGFGRRPLKAVSTEVVVQRVPEGVKGRRPGRKALAPA